MPFGAARTSQFLLSPMPGLLVDIAVQLGQEGAAGEKLAVIEAMKMENILNRRAGRRGRRRCRCRKGREPVRRPGHPRLAE